MGLTNNDTTFLFYSKKLGVSFANTLMLGRLQLYAKKEYILSCINKFKNNEKSLDEVVFKDEFSEPLFEILGAKTINSLDFSDYEKATIIHDLNMPLDKKYDNSFTAIIDGGTIEHVFNFPVAIKNCMKALKVGGHYLGITPANNSMGHGFYQFSPELFYRIFSEENGFTVKKMFIYASKDNEDAKNWYEIADPKSVNSRIMLVNSLPTYLMIIAEKIAEKEIFSITPQQSDYITTWAVSESIQKNSKAKNDSTLKFIYRKILPKRIKTILRNLYDIYSTQKTDTDDFGTINTEHFKKFEL